MTSPSHSRRHCDPCVQSDLTEIAGRYEACPYCHEPFCSRHMLPLNHTCIPSDGLTAAAIETAQQAFHHLSATIDPNVRAREARLTIYLVASGLARAFDPAALDPSRAYSATIDAIASQLRDQVSSPPTAILDTPRK